MFMQKFFLLFICLLSMAVPAEELRIYGFTSSFVDCVRKYDNEVQSFSKGGAAQSALMNGSTVLSGAELDGQFWQYMDCLTPAASGVDSRTLSQTTACPELDINLGDRRIYVPPSVNGKEFKLGGASWICDEGSWSKSGTGADATQPLKQCLSSRVSVGSCAYEVPEKPHGTSFWAQSSPYGQGVNGFLSGQSLFVCRDGTWIAEQGSSSCAPQTCSSGQTMIWRGASASQCSGTIDEFGVAQQEVAAPRYFSSLRDAELLTRITSGSAEYACTERGWKLVSSSCTQKKPTELSCSSRKTSIGTTEYSCH